MPLLRCAVDGCCYWRNEPCGWSSWCSVLGCAWTGSARSWSPTPLAILLTLLVGAVCGLINGFLVVKLKLSGFIITLAMSFVYEGIAIGVSHGYAL